MKRIALAASLFAAFATTGGALAADKHPAVKARQSVMQLYAHYLGTLGAMAKGTVEYDAAKASAAADSLNALMGLSQANMWTQGTDNVALAGQTDALPAIWTTYPAINEKVDALKAASANMAAVAGDGLPAVQGAIGNVGKSCGGCHEDFRHKD